MPKQGRQPQSPRRAGRADGGRPAAAEGGWARRKQGTRDKGQCTSFALAGSMAMAFGVTEEPTEEHVYVFMQFMQSAEMRFKMGCGDRGRLMAPAKGTPPVATRVRAF